MEKPTICIGENKDADQLRGTREADQRLCFRYTDSTLPLLSKSKISSLLPSSVTVQPGLCGTWSEFKLLVFSCTGSFTPEVSSFYSFRKFFILHAHALRCYLILWYPHLCNTCLSIHASCYVHALISYFQYFSPLGASRLNI